MSEPTKPTASARERLDALPPAATSDALDGPRAELAKVIPRRPRVTWLLGVALAVAFSVLAIPTITVERWLGAIGKVEHGKPSPVTVRVPPFAGYSTSGGHTGGGGVLIRRGEVPDRDTAAAAADIDATMPHGPVPYIAYFLLVAVLGGLFTHHMRRSTYGRLLRVQLVSLALILVAAIVVKIVMLTTALSVLVVPVALFALVPTLVLDRIVGLATGTLAALVVSLLVPFDVSVAILLLVQAGAAGLVIAERPKKRMRAAIMAGAVATLFTAATYPLMLYLTTGRLPIAELRDPVHSAWLAAAVGPALATVLGLMFVPLYQLLVGEITLGKLVELEDLSHPLLKQIADKAPGTWQHSLSMANMAEIAANSIGANGRLVRVGAYFHDLGKSLQPKYFIENLEPGETSPHDKLPPEVSCDAIFSHVTEGIVTARRSGLHERIIDFMHMHHGNGVLEYFWGKTKQEGNPRGLSVENFRYPGVPPQSRETAILSICDAVEAASRTLKKPEVGAIDNLVQRIVYGKLHLGQLDESGLSMGDLRRVAESLRETIRHANHGRIEYPWQKAQQDASASADQDKLTQTGPRLDSLDRPARPESVAAAAARSAGSSDDAFAVTDSAGATPKLRIGARESNELAMVTTAPVANKAAPAKRDSGDIAGDGAATSPVIKMEMDDENLAKSSPIRRAPAAPVRDAADAQAWRAEATNPGRDLSAELSIPPGNPITDYMETRRAPKQDLDDEVVELHAAKPKLDEAAKVSLADLASRGARMQTQGSKPDMASSTLEIGTDPQESDPRMRRVTDPVDPGGRTSSPEAAQFALEAKQALEDSVKPRESADAIRSGVDDSGAKSADAPAARKRAATLPPIGRPPTIPPPLSSGRRAPTIPPITNTLPPMGVTVLPANPRPSSVPPALTSPPPDVLRPPASPSGSHGYRGETAPPPSMVRPPGPNLLDDMVTLKPQYERRAPDLIVQESPDGSVLIQPAKPVELDPATTAPSLGLYEAAKQSSREIEQPTFLDRDSDDSKTQPTDDPSRTNPAMGRDDAARFASTRDEDLERFKAAADEPSFFDRDREDARTTPRAEREDAASTQPSMLRAEDVGDQTTPNLELASRTSQGPESSWARGLAARLERQLDEDFGTETPASPPSRAELQALLNSPPDPTRQQSLDEIEALHRQTRDRRSEPELELRRPGSATAEVTDEDIESAIEVAPPARRTAIGVMKKKTPPSE